MLTSRQVLTLCIFKIALRESDKHGKYVLNKLEVYIEKEGLDAALKHLKGELEDNILKHLKKDLKNWRNEVVKLAVTGKSGVGKSSFINAIRNLKLGDLGFAKTSCAGHTTKCATVYEYPGNPKITLHDLPCFETTKCSENKYKERMELSKYHCFLIFVANIEGHDIEIAKILRAMKKPFCFVRSKLDLDFQNAKNDRESKENAIEKIVSDSSDILTTSEFKEAMFFVISSFNRRIGHFNELVLYIQSNLPPLKCDVVKLSMFGELSDDIIDSKYKLLKDRLLKVSATSLCLATKPIVSMFNISLICKELLLYHKAFGFEQQFVKDILKDDQIRQKLNASSIVEIQPADRSMDTFVKTELRKLQTSESVVLTCPAGVDTFRLLNQVLDGCRDDAKLVYLHQMNFDDLSKFFFIIYLNRIIVVIVSVFSSSVVDLGLEPK